MNIFEKKALYSFGCPDYHAPVDRLHLIAALAPDYETKKLFFNLAVKLSVEETEHWYQCFFRTLRQEILSVCPITSICRTDSPFPLSRLSERTTRA